MITSVNSTEETLRRILEKRKEASLYRSLQVNKGLLDFCSNDYVSFARSEKIKQQVNKYAGSFPHLSGATGSRSISGNTLFAEELEKQIALFHHAESGLLFNSGYDANVGLFSSIAQKGDTIICDELIHASIIDGSRLSYANRFRFAHNDVSDLEKKLQNAKGNIFVAVESIYSMDGDMAPLKDISRICKQYDANLIVDEAHSTGVFGKQGRGLLDQLELEKEAFARIHTFGKAMGCHGAIVLGSELLRNYLINFARSFIFTTALPVHSLLTIRAAYDQLSFIDFDNSELHKLIRHFRNGFKAANDVYLIGSIGPIQSVVIPGNERARAASRQLQEKGFDIRAVLSPSVPGGKERLRISLHLHNTPGQVDQLLQLLNEIILS
jgi:8-amino-7-oxononanoate synthase